MLEKMPQDTLLVDQIDDNDIIVFVHVAHLDISMLIYNCAYTEDFYVAEDWYSMNDIDLQSPAHPSILVVFYNSHPFLFLPCFLHPKFLTIPCTFRADPQVSSSRWSCVMNMFWMFVPQISRTWVTISREMVGSTTSPM